MRSHPDAHRESIQNWFARIQKPVSSKRNVLLCVTIRACLGSVLMDDRSIMTGFSAGMISLQ